MQLIGSIRQLAQNLTPPRLRAWATWYVPFLAALLSPLKSWHDAVWPALYEYVQRNKGRGPYRLAILAALEAKYGAGFEFIYDDSWTPSIYLRYDEENIDGLELRYGQEGQDTPEVRYEQEALPPLDFTIICPFNLTATITDDEIAAVVGEYREPGSRWRLVRPTTDEVNTETYPK